MFKLSYCCLVPCNILQLSSVSSKLSKRLKIGLASSTLMCAAWWHLLAPETKQSQWQIKIPLKGMWNNHHLLYMCWPHMVTTAVPVRTSPGQRSQHRKQSGCWSSCSICAAVIHEFKLRALILSQKLWAANNAWRDVQENGAPGVPGGFVRVTAQGSWRFKSSVLTLKKLSRGSFKLQR